MIDPIVRHYAAIVILTIILSVVGTYLYHRKRKSE